MPYRLVGSVRFYDRREIRDLVSYLKLIANPWDDEAFRRAISVPRRGLGEMSIDTLAEAARKAGLPMLEAAGRADIVGVLRPAARKTLAEFTEMIGRFRAQAGDASVDELLRDIIDTIQYGAYLQIEGPES